MYHIKKDARCMRSAEEIRASLLRCLDKKRFSDITITDIHRECGVSRATFYRLFDNTIDVVQFSCDRLFADFAEGIACRRVDGSDVLAVFSRHIVENAELIEKLSENDLLHLLHRSHANFGGVIGGILGLDGGTEARSAYHNAILSSVMVGVVVEWARRGRIDSPAEIEGAVRDVMRLELLDR